MTCIFLSCFEKTNDNKEFSHENSKPYCESQVIKSNPLCI